MGLRLTPRDEGFFGLFGRSAAYVVAATDELSAILGAVDGPERKAIAKRIGELENSADEATHEIDLGGGLEMSAEHCATESIDRDLPTFAVEVDHVGVDPLVFNRRHGRSHVACKLSHALLGEQRLYRSSPG